MAQPPVRRAARRPTRPAVAVAAVVLLAVTGPAALAGCGAAVPTSPPTGVDRLVVPTPSPDPTDFVAGVDNTWLAWTPGSQTRFTSPAGTVVQQVGAATTDVAGLRATRVTTTAPGAPPSTDLFAQDDAGNVWWVGREGEWQVGQDDARAGLWMPAAPRRGDGFRTALVPGVVEDVARVDLAPPADAGSAYDAPNVEDGSAGDEVRLEVRSELDPQRVEVRTYVEGLGLVSRSVTGGAEPGVLWTRERTDAPGAQD